MEVNQMGKRIEHKLPEIGTVFFKTYKARGEKQARNLELKIVKVGNGIGYRFDGKVYNTPTAAAKSLLHYEVDGWKFWRIKG
jgi:hypothetical protein